MDYAIGRAVEVRCKDRGVDRAATAEGSEGAAGVGDIAIYEVGGRLAQGKSQGRRLTDPKIALVACD